MRRLTIGLALLTLFAGAYLYWHVSQPKHFTLKAINHTDRPVTSVSLFGTALDDESGISDIAAGGEAQLTVTLKRDGMLRVRIEQGMNRADTILADDVARLSNAQQTLHIRPGNRFILE